jgi:hypothetical protein
MPCTTEVVQVSVFSQRVDYWPVRLPGAIALVPVLLVVLGYCLYPINQVLAQKMVALELEKICFQKS